MSGDVRYVTKTAAPFQFVPISAEQRQGGSCPPEFSDRVLIYTVHDGDCVPEQILQSPEVEPLRNNGVLWKRYVQERDWGANFLARNLAETLGLPGYYRVTIARVVLDFNRFPGNTPWSPGVQEAESADRLAIFDPLARVLTHQEKRMLLQDYYDPMSEAFEAALDGKILVIAFHTYDQRNPSRTERPAVSLLSRSHSYQQHSRLPHGMFDPLLPDALVESTAGRVVCNRIALELEKAGITVEHNYPYLLPDGSLEVRSQARYFFQFLRSRFEEQLPAFASDESHAWVWRALGSTNPRFLDSALLAGYLHRFERAPSGEEARLESARLAYENIGAFLAARPQLVDRFRVSAERTSALAIEVRKDLISEFDGDTPVACSEDIARFIARQIARAVAEYLVHDHVQAR